MSAGDLSAASSFAPPAEVLSSALNTAGTDIFSGTVSLMERAEELEQVPCRSTAELLTDLGGRLEQIQRAGCCDCQVSIAGLRMALESTQAVPLGQIAGAIAKLDLTLSSLPQMPVVQNLPIGQFPPGTTITIPPAPPPAEEQPSPGDGVPISESPTQPAPTEGEAPSAPVSTYREPKEGEVCPPSDTDAPEPGAVVKIFPECVAQLHALGGPVAEGAMTPAVFWTEEPGERMIGKLRPVSDPVMDTIIRSADWAELLGRLAALLPEIP